MSMKSGIDVRATLGSGTDSREYIFGLMADRDRLFTCDGMPHGFVSTGLGHVVKFVKSFLPTGATVSASFPEFVADESGTIVKEATLPYVAVKGILGLSKEVGIGGKIAETPTGYVYSFNQVMYFEFDIFGKRNMKIDQITEQIALQFQIAKRCGGTLWEKGFQNFRVVSSDPARGFRFDLAWDFRMQHQYADMLHSRVTIRSSFDVVWHDTSEVNGIISMIVFGQTEDIPWSTTIGSQMGWLTLERREWNWFGGTVP